MPAVILGEEQISSLFAFCESQHVGYYDLQVELVDHLAQAIEEKLEVSPSLSFDTALNQVYTDFGKGGFKQIISEQQKQMVASNRQMRMAYFAGYFKWPKVMLTFLLLTILISAEFYLPIDVLVDFTMVGSFSALAFEALLVMTQRKKAARPRTPLLLLSYKGITWVSPLFTNIFLNIYLSFFRMAGVPTKTLLTYNIFIVLLVLTIALILAGNDTKTKLYALAEERFPAVFR